MPTDPPSSGPRPGGTIPADRSDRGYRWLRANGLYVECLVALFTLAVGGGSAVLITVGAVFHQPRGRPPGETGSSGPTGILELGSTLYEVTILLAVLLGGLLLVHGAVELWAAVADWRGRGSHGHEQGSPEHESGSPEHGQGGRDWTDRAYVGVRTVQTVAAAAFTLPIVAGVVLSALGVGGEPTNRQVVTLFGAYLLMLASVFAHGVGRGVRTVATDW